MNVYKKQKNRLEKYLQTERGKRFINFAYSIGAAIVILGAMFKLLHFPFGNELLFIGMATEVIVFTLSAFDTPIRDYSWDKVFPALTGSEQGVTPVQPPTGVAETAIHYPNKRADYPSQAGGYYNSQAGEDFNPQTGEDFNPQTKEYSKQIENLNRTLAGLNSLYEVQLKSVSSQVSSIDDINNLKTETEKMARQLKELNEVYSRMLQAMSSNKEQ